MQSCRFLCTKVCRVSTLNRLSNKCIRNSLAERTFLCASQQQLYSGDAIAQAQPSTADKQYSPKIQRIVEDISQLTLIETADLNELLKKTLNIQDAPVMAYGGPAVAPQQEEDDEPARKEKTSFTVKLMKFEESKKVQLIKEIKNLMEGMNLVQAKKFVESTPIVVKADVAKDEAEKLKAAIDAAGGVAEVE
ncbi:large ribosomal subunit protein bL12m-like [Liolophura sinensis]|uniref:large ribosomal subunit protein bL12m-like n=1 Tax=Liolophura sinensis TaxID=3198878 RepID=UPI003158228C